ncbi:MAG: hypothetical protein KBF59_09330 [Ignavibacterium sp.]|jgi:hypothetical protein|nr:hypothetical protein [Bacteroidota bacterium]MBP9121053.1 hypothetical protein [Ignavibacterium sp.]
MVKINSPLDIPATISFEFSGTRNMIAHDGVHEFIVNEILIERTNKSLNEKLTFTQNIRNNLILISLFSGNIYFKSNDNWEVPQFPRLSERKFVISENGTQIFGEFTLFDQIIENVLHRERYLFRIDFNNRDNPILKIFDNLPII